MDDEKIGRPSRTTWRVTGWQRRPPRRGPAFSRSRSATAAALGGLTVSSAKNSAAALEWQSHETQALVQYEVMTLSRQPLVICLTALAVSALLTSCAVGPHFKKPEAPKVDGYTPSPLPPTTASATNIVGGEAQRFVSGQDSLLNGGRPTNALNWTSWWTKRCAATPASRRLGRRCARPQEFVHAQQGYYYPSVSGKLQCDSPASGRERGQQQRSRLSS